MPFLITRADADQPIVAANRAFLDLTGYPPEEVIGRNCRFLQGHGSEPEAIAHLYVAVREGCPAFASILNYRRDGSSFQNAVTIAPILDDEGKVAWFLGSQMGVPLAVRKEASVLAITTLSQRQRQVLAAMTRGMRSKQIATQLGISERTVHMHRASLITGLKVSSSAEAVRVGVEAGL